MLSKRAKTKNLSHLLSVRLEHRREQHEVDRPVEDVEEDEECGEHVGGRPVECQLELGEPRLTI